MSSVNLHAREISLKVVYYGPGLGGKTSSLQHIHRTVKPEARGQLVSLSTGVDRTLYFDFLPIKLPKLRGYTVRLQLYTVPGQVHYNSTRKLVLTCADGIVFVADSQAARREANVESLANLQENLREQGLSLDKMPHLLQFNKRDLPELLPVAELNEELNPFHAPAFETSAASGTGVFDALKSITTLVLSDLRRRGVWRTGDKSVVAAPLADGPREYVDGDLADSTPTTDGSIARTLQELAERRGSEPKPKPEGSAPPPIAAALLDSALRPLRPEDAALLVDGGMLARGAALSEILPPGSQRDAVVSVEYLIHRGDYAGAVAKTAKLFNDAAAGSATGAGTAGQEGPALYALMLGLPGTRYLRFRDTVARAASGGASSADALYALFFLIDVVLRT